MKSFVITAARESLQHDDDLNVHRALIHVSDHALVSVQDVYWMPDDNTMDATVVVIEPVAIDDKGQPHSFEELEAVKQAALEQAEKPKPKGGRRSRKGLELIEGGGEEE